MTVRRLVLLLLLGALLVAPLFFIGTCAPRATTEWIDDESAVVRCVQAGPERRRTALFDALPGPPVPEGLYAGDMAPPALDALGFEPEAPVCATLLPPSAAQISEIRRTIPNLNRARRDADRALDAEFGQCACTHAYARGVRRLLSICKQSRTRPSCESGPDELAKFDELFAPVADAIASIYIPRVHWRLVGISDRPGWALAHRSGMVARYSGGSEIFLPGAPIPEHGNDELLRALLAEEGVTAVIRQDAGLGFLVFRVFDGEVLVLDHFAYPDVGPEIRRLASDLDDAQEFNYVRQLAKPTVVRALSHDPSLGDMLELDHVGLTRVDESIVAVSMLSPRPYDVEREKWEHPPSLVDRVSVQVPHETPDLLTAVGALSQTGVPLMQPSTEHFPSHLDRFLPVDTPVTFQADGTNPGFVFRGTPTEQIWFTGLNALPRVLQNLEYAEAGRVTGTFDAWQVNFPTGPLPGDFESRAGIRALRARISKEATQLRAKLTDDGRTLSLELGPPAD